MTDLPAERAVLSALWSYGTAALDEVSDLVTPRTFSDQENRAVFEVLVHALADRPDARPDLASVMSSARALGVELDPRYLRAIEVFPVRRENVLRLAARVRKLEVARLLHAQHAEAMRRLSEVTGDEPVDRILSISEEPVLDLTSLLSEQGGGVQRMGCDAVEYASHLMDNPRQAMGVPTGLPRLDRAIGGGLRPNSMDVVAARAKTGKGMLSNHVACHVAGAGVPVFYLDTEMSREEHQHRLLAKMSGCRIEEIETGRAGREARTRKAVLEAARRLGEMPYYYECVIGKSFEEVLSSMRRWVVRTVGLDDSGRAKPCVVIYDYIKMMSADFLSGDLKEYQALGFVATAIKNFCGRYAVPCLTFAQLNRDGIEREDESAIAGSDRIVHYATSVTLYKHKSEAELAELPRYSHKLVPLVSRHGRGLKKGDYINIETDYERGRLREGPTRYELETGAGEAPDPIWPR